MKGGLNIGLDVTIVERNRVSSENSFITLSYPFYIEFIKNWDDTAVYTALSFCCTLLAF